MKLLLAQFHKLVRKQEIGGYIIWHCYFSLFKLLISNLQAQAENFPFCTIDPNENRVAVPDSRWEHLCEVHKPASKVPAYLNVVDIAGLVKGASEGCGLGNAFLSHISVCDAIFHMTRAFADKEVGAVVCCLEMYIFAIIFVFIFIFILN